MSEHDDIYQRYQPQGPLENDRLIRLAELEVQVREAESRLAQAKAAGDEFAIKAFKADVRAARETYRKVAKSAGMRAIVHVVDNDGTADSEV